MNTPTTYLIAGSAALIVLLAGLFFYGTFIAPATPSTENRGTIQSPFDETVIPSPTVTLPSQPGGAKNPDETTTSGTLEVRTAGGMATVSDFRAAKDVASSTDGSYYFVSGAQIQIGTTTESIPEYQIYYFPADQTFLVSLLQEPLGEVRKRATQDLASRLNIPPEGICSLVAEVTIPRDVNQFYSGKSLGFPGCSGATKFPGD